jgi:hypothetical protein
VNWNAIGALGELTGALAVMVSLVYLAIQVRQNTRSIRGAMYSTIVQSFQQLNMISASDSEVAELLEAGVEDWDSLAAVDRSRLLHGFFSLFKNFENAYYQYWQGTLEPGLWEGWSLLMRSYYAKPGVQSWWQLRRRAFSTEFREFLESSRTEEFLPAPREMTRPGQAATAGDSGGND